LSKDYIQAINWYRRAADAGDAQAMGDMGRMYEQGRGGLAKDNLQAVSWYRKGAELGDRDASEALKRLNR
jgi:uncharacterized protein